MRTPNYNFERQERDKAKAAKKAEKAAAKAAKTAADGGQHEDREALPDPSSPSAN
ncbi:hypothetical protein [Aureimonas jatrophae]|uniref:Uncharacterized protein n=1 Tax=Aureimonas jatrophae TaxID=1166073 RepID=A0A1H0FN88_9HYPH|nr:hypothetical protein [Aureimonas jatrophae]MBB3949934.1 translation initiation factor 2 alpha subunit (eIF-2alpha) [Aureimonas jatrophae]SDN96143.1 hypothetical protein SAMN05192530_102600 [Aureimonas jatrophae]